MNSHRRMREAWPLREEKVGSMEESEPNALTCVQWAARLESHLGHSESEWGNTGPTWTSKQPFCVQD